MKYYDITWNPLTGCSRCSQGCEHCTALDNLARQGRSILPTVNRKVVDRPPLMDGATVMVCSQTDILHSSYRDSDIRDVLSRLIHDNTYLVCTKRSSRIHSIFEGIDNPSLYVGVSIESQEYVSRADDLINTSGNFKRWLCVEPLIGEVELLPVLKTGKIDWVELCAERGDNARPCRVEWIRRAVQSCLVTHTPVFVNGIFLDGHYTDNLEEFPEDLRVRQYSWERGVETNYVGLLGKILYRDGMFEVDSPDYVYQYFKESYEYYETILDRVDGKKYLYRVRVKSLPAEPRGDTIRSYWYFMSRKLKEINR